MKSLILSLLFMSILSFSEEKSEIIDFSASCYIAVSRHEDNLIIDNYSTKSFSNTKTGYTVISDRSSRADNEDKILNKISYLTAHSLLNTSFLCVNKSNDGMGAYKADICSKYLKEAEHKDFGTSIVSFISDYLSDDYEKDKSISNKEALMKSKSLELSYWSGKTTEIKESFRQDVKKIIRTFCEVTKI